TTTRSSSARSTAPNRTTAPSPIVTSPRTVALEATKADGWICGWGRSGLTLFCDTYGNVAAVETHPAHDPDGGRALDEAVLVGRLGPLAEQGPDGCSQPRLGAVRSLGLRLLRRQRLGTGRRGKGGGRYGTGTSSTFGWIHGTGASSSGADSSAAWAAPWEARCRGGSSGTSTACSTATSAWRSRAVARSTFAQN